MGSRLSARWILVGALIMLGAIWLMHQLSFRTNVANESLRYVLIAAGPAVAGALLVAFAPLRPWREPLLSAVAAMLASIVVVLVQARGREMMAEQWPQFVLNLGIACISVLSAAALLRWVMPRFKSGPASIVVLGGLITLGFVATMLSIGAVLDIETSLFRVIVTFVGIFLGGYLTQGSISVQRAWLCGSGSLLLLLRLLANPSFDREMLPAIFFCFVIGRWGAVVAWRRMVARGHQPDAEVPAAHVS